MMTVRVRVGEPGGRATGVAVVALWERHPDHPGGEVFLAGEGEFEVALTPAVEARLRDGRLIVVDHVDHVDPASLSLAKGKKQGEPAIAPAIVETSEAAEPPKPRKKTPARKGGL